MTDVVEKYRPSNGTEGECFYEGWCRHCARDLAMSEGADYDACDDNQICKIIGDTMFYNLDDKEYPIEWIRRNGTPECTAFVQAGHPIPLKDDLTIDMFGNEK